MAQEATAHSVEIDLASRVGVTFAAQYYYALHAKPDNLHKFFSDSSKLTRAESSLGIASTVTSVKAIHEKVMSLNYSDFKAEIKSVDAQESLNGGVIVMVSGSITTADEGKRNFVQSFFLAREKEEAYFVLNDLFRFLDDGPQAKEQSKQPSLQPVNGFKKETDHAFVGQQTETATESEEAYAEETALVEQQSEQALIPQSVTENTSVETEFLKPDDPASTEILEADERLPVTELSVSSASELQQPEVPAVELVQEQLASVVLPLANASTTQLPASTPVLDENAPKKSYASILQSLKKGGSAPAANEPSAAATSTSGASGSISQTSAAGPAGRKPGGSDAGKASTSASQGDGKIVNQGLSTSQASSSAADSATDAEGHSVFIRNLPPQTVPSDIVTHFQQFGVLKADKIQIRGQKGAASVYAFVEFVDAASAQAAIEKSPLMISGFYVRVEEKKPAANTGPRPGGGRGGRGGMPGTGSANRGGFRNDGGNRGRGGSVYSQNTGPGMGGGRSGGNPMRRGGGGGARGGGTQVYAQKIVAPSGAAPTS